MASLNFAKEHNELDIVDLITEHNFDNQDVEMRNPYFLFGSRQLDGHI